MPIGRTIEVEGNQLRLIADGPDRFAALMDLIGDARESLCLYFYTFAPDEAGKAVGEALVEACGRGVDVTLMIDAFGSNGTSAAFLTPLVKAGVRFGRFGYRPSTRYLIRNHQKMAIADRKRAIIGGFNIAQDYFADAKDDGAWCDLGVLMEGPAVGVLQAWYDRLAAWVFDSDQRFRSLRRMVRDWSPGEGRLQWLMGGPARRLSGWVRRVKGDLETGKRLDMVAAYFSPGRSMLKRIMRLAKRGDARLIVPLYSDNTATIGAARHLYRRMLNSGVRLFEYTRGKLHMKVIVIDDVAYVGSANFDKRSLYLNVELMLRVADPDFAEAVRDIIVRREAEARPIDMAAYRAMAGPVARIRWLISYALVGVLDYTMTRRLNFRSEPR
ncbi:MAG TPA: phosphatidylserine/phosphatidylglycerophosphate/cardiolipin synthase family protein [Sphingobium sp.]|nr:phosphatidylserine/phosphatidylglycerophosphate/cardiolipin synthase family protein [Sphingobium sp.]